MEAESATTTGSVFTPDPASSAESAWSGKGLLLTKGRTATFALGSGTHEVEAVVQSTERGSGTVPVSRWSGGGVTTTLSSSVGAQGITAMPGALRAQTVGTVRGGTLTVRALAGEVRIDALLVRPETQTVAFTGAGAVTLAVDTAGRGSVAVRPGDRVERFRADGTSSGTVVARHAGSLRLPKGGFALEMR